MLSSNSVKLTKFWVVSCSLSLESCLLTRYHHTPVELTSNQLKDMQSIATQ